MDAAMIVPPTLRRFSVPGRVLEDTRALLAEPGEDGLECIVVWIGRPRDAETADVLWALRPRQIAYRSDEGLAVEVPPEALLELISGLPEDTAILVRVHTHPTDAYHSPLDDTNMLISHQGAVSIVVPWFAREPIMLDRCSVNVLDHGRGWHELSPSEVQERFEVR
jgi:hypothetical protein